MVFRKILVQGIRVAKINLVKYKGEILKEKNPSFILFVMDIRVLPLLFLFFFFFFFFLRYICLFESVIKRETERQKMRSFIL